MTETRSPGRNRVAGAIRVVAVLGAGCVAGAAPAQDASQYQIRQRGRAFTPNYVDMRGGETIVFINDDGELLHHAYLDSKDFSFDTGDQEPGSRVNVNFPRPGRSRSCAASIPR